MFGHRSIHICLGLIGNSFPDKVQLLFKRTCDQNNSSLSALRPWSKIFRVEPLALLVEEST